MKISYEHYFMDEYTGEIATYEWQLPTGNHSEIWYFNANEFNIKVSHKPNYGYVCDGYEWPDFRSAIQYVQTLCMYAVI